jgi:hypothetical protein
MVNVDLTGLAERYYDSKHYLFLVLSHNSLSTISEFSGGEVIKLPPRGPGARLSLAKKLQNQSTSVPV